MEVLAIQIINTTGLWLILLDVFVWLIIHVAVSYICFKIPLSFFSKDIKWFRIRKWELKGKIYQRIFNIKRWKGIIPDGGGLFNKGFPKKSLKSSHFEYLKIFLYETKRAELTHWLIILPVPIFFIWNLWWIGIIMIIYAMIVNIPCILLQRYNRARIEYLFYR
jgi:glycosyl-4,4'-diaponeurosporenoate acyltransferase